ncbi:hypothetical protein [Kitasatospora sp. NPDC002040]|uniref:hypothetical protein n=1 Tax=Kitasatospora sp. NPDC002040 TaxID=3154661 RepID=UPI00332A1C98
MTKHERRITEPAAPSHGVFSTPPVSRLRAQSASLLGEPVVVMIQPDTISFTSLDGKLLTADTVELSVRESGGQPLVLPQTFGPEVAPGWKARLTARTDELVIHYPNGLVFYDGTMPTNGPWLSKVAAAGSLVMVTGPMAGLPDMEPVILAGRAMWVRLPLTVS